MTRRDYAVLIDKQLGMVSLRQWKLGYPFIRQLIGIIADVYVFCIHHVTY